MNLEAIGAEFGITAHLTRRRLRECRIEVRDKYELPISCSELRAMYEDGKMSMTAIVRECGVSMLAVSYTLEECGIMKRTQSETKKLARRGVDIDSALLKWLYEDRKMSTTQIGVMFGIHQTTAWERLNAIGVAMRPTGSKPGRRTYRHVRSSDGDAMLYMPEHERSNGWGWIRLRFLAYEKFHGELPPKGDRIHLIDGNMENLSRSNLRAMTNSEHSKFHCFANLRARGNAFKPCPKEDLARYMREWDEEKNNETNENVD